MFLHGDRVLFHRRAASVRPLRMMARAPLASASHRGWHRHSTVRAGPLDRRQEGFGWRWWGLGVSCPVQARDWPANRTRRQHLVVETKEGKGRDVPILDAKTWALEERSWNECVARIESTARFFAGYVEGMVVAMGWGVAQIRFFIVRESGTFNQPTWVNILICV